MEEVRARLDAAAEQPERTALIFPPTHEEPSHDGQNANVEDAEETDGRHADAADEGVTRRAGQKGPGQEV